MNLENFIYEFNLTTTITVKNTDEWVYVLNNRLNKEIDFSNSISFYNIVDLFNKLYLFFKKDYDKLTKLNLGKKVEIVKFDSYKSKDGDSETLVIYIDEPNKDIFDLESESAILYLYKDGDKIHNYISNGLYPYDENHRTKVLPMGIELMKEYLNFARKYGLLIESYNFLQNKFIFGNGTTCVFSKINGDLEEGLSTFEMSFGNNFFNTSDYINVVFNLGEKLSIDYDSSKVILRLDEMVDKKEIIDKLIYNLFINREKLSKMYSGENVKKLTK